MFRPVFLLFIVVVATASLAQNVLFDSNDSGRGSVSDLSGNVTDKLGHPISGAKIEIQDSSSGRVVATGQSFVNGSYEFPMLRHGRYTLVATSGLSESRTDIWFNNDTEINLQISPTVGTTTETTGGQSTVSVAQMKVPGKAQKLFHKAMEAFRGSKVDDAFKYVQQALGFYPNYAQALTLRGVMHLERGDTRSAQPDLEKAVQLDYTDGMGYFALGSLYNVEGNFDRALQVVEHGISLSPQSWQGYLEMAKSHLGKRDFDRALADLVKAEKFAPEQTSIIHLFRAKALVGKSNLQAAATELQAYLDKEPAGPSADKARGALEKLRAAALAAQK
jgi:tetratricopeptide (TPR) repeat protein